MGGDLSLLLVGFFDDDTDFVDRERGMLPIGVDLDEVGAVSELLADGAAGFFEATDHLRTGRKVGEIGGDSEGIVLSDGGGGAGGNLHARALGESFGDRVTKGDVGVTRAFVFDIANRRVSGFESNASVVGAFERPEGLRLGREVEDVSVVAFRNARHNVRVAVDESGEKRGAAEVDDLGIFGIVRLDVGGGADFLDAVAFDPESGVVEVAAFADVEEVGGFEDDGGGRGGGGLGAGGGEEGEEEERKGARFHGEKA